MAHLITVNGSEQRVDPPTSEGFYLADFSAVIGPEVRIVALNEYILMVVSDLAANLTTGRNDKATDIVKRVLGDPAYEVYGDALFVTREEMTAFRLEYACPRRRN